MTWSRKSPPSLIAAASNHKHNTYILSCRAFATLCVFFIHFRSVIGKMTRSIHLTLLDTRWEITLWWRRIMTPHYYVTPWSHTISRMPKRFYTDLGLFIWHCWVSGDKSGEFQETSLESFRRQDLRISGDKSWEFQTTSLESFRRQVWRVSEDKCREFQETSVECFRRLLRWRDLACFIADNYEEFLLCHS